MFAIQTRIATLRRNAKEEIVIVKENTSEMGNTAEVNNIFLRFSIESLITYIA